MLRRLALDDFGHGAAPWDAAGTPAGASEPGRPAPGVAAVDLEEERLASYENGYSAGWEDASKAHAEEQGHISAELARNLQDLSFTFHEAQAALVQDMEAILSGIVERVLPLALRPAIAELVVSRALEVAREPGQLVEIVVAPENVARVETLCHGRPTPPLRVTAEPSLGAGQAFVRFAACEEKIDLDAILDEMGFAMGRALCREDAPLSGPASDQERAADDVRVREAHHG
jgi:flagellar assembly protein FliH